MGRLERIKQSEQAKTRFALRIGQEIGDKACEAIYPYCSRRNTSQKRSRT